MNELNKKKGIQSSMNPVENLSGGRALFNLSRVEILPEDDSVSTVVASGNPVPRSISVYPTYARQFINVERSKDGNSEQTKACDLKNLGKFGSGLSCCWALFTA